MLGLLDSKTSENGAAKRRVAYMTESFTMGGVEQSTAMLIANLNKDRFEPILICANEPDIAPLVQNVRAMGVNVVQTDLLSVRRSNMSVKNIRALSQLLKDLKVDLIHVQVLGGTGARYIALAAKVAHIDAVIITIRGALSGAVGFKERLVTRLIDRTCVTVYTTASEDNRRQQIELVGRDPDQVEVIYNAIDLRRFNPEIDGAETRRALNFPPSGPLVGTIGRLAEQKGIETFLAMAAHVHAAMPDVSFVIVGEGPKRSEYEGVAKEKGVDGYVRFAGYHSDVDRCLAALDVFALASVFEPFGLVLAEAMAMKKPVVATRVGGIPEVVATGETGFVVPAGDAEAMSIAVQKYLKDPALAREHGEAGRKRVEACFSIPRLMSEMESLYDRVLLGAARR
ncbi:glycosyl transferase [Capsulimonas corticalis]|uniref:Glycosyl transferase n=1 Tax=Capsulimonas corticalis TaxID=2219043 RepID=A0A402D1R7_9BACT|nr:glycosyltransferase [Capsulimonas corticalis]BDI28727.1 glycosyl transferase [Capsulimonas corticalis]